MTYNDNGLLEIYTADYLMELETHWVINMEQQSLENKLAKALQDSESNPSQKLSEYMNRLKLRIAALEKVEKIHYAKQMLKPTQTDIWHTRINDLKQEGYNIEKMRQELMNTWVKNPFAPIDKISNRKENLCKEIPLPDSLSEEVSRRSFLPLFDHKTSKTSVFKNSKDES